MSVAVRDHADVKLHQKNKEEKSQELSIIEQVVVQGDLSKLDPEQRVLYYRKVCESAGLNPYSRPFEYIILNGRLTLYTKKDATEQLRKLNGISIEKLEENVIDDLYIVKATARTKDGRTDQATGAVTIGHLKGDAKANAIMKAETKAKRRVTLSISGMGWTDETEIESIPNAKMVEVDHVTGEIKKEISANFEIPVQQISDKPSEAYSISVVELVSQEQKQDFDKSLGECSKELQKTIQDYLKTQLKIESTSQLPVKQYNLLRKKILRENEKASEPKTGTENA